MSEDRLYHGTRRGFRPGGYLLPRRFHQGEGTSAPLNPGKESPAGADRWVYVTTSLDLAWVYAWHAPGRGKPKVLVIEARGVIERDPEHSRLEQIAWRTEWAKVLRVLTEPTMTEAEAREGWITT